MENIRCTICGSIDVGVPSGNPGYTSGSESIVFLECRSCGAIIEVHEELPLEPMYEPDPYDYEEPRIEPQGFYDDDGGFDPGIGG